MLGPRGDVQSSLMPFMLAAVVLAGCGRHDTSTPPLSELVAVAVQVAESDARQEAVSPALARGPLYLDTSYIHMGQPEPIDSGTVRIALQKRLVKPYLQGAKSEAIRCVENRNRSCWVADSGVYVRVDTILSGGPGASVFTTSATTIARGSEYTAICTRQLRLRFVARGDTWALDEKLLLGTC
jgi:hypothetical protein